FLLIFIFGVFSFTVYFLMRFRNRSACLAFTALVFAVLPGLAAAQENPWEKENADWREAHKADLLKPDGWLSLAGLRRSALCASRQTDLLKPDGWLSLAGLEWLQPGDNSVGSAPDSKIHLASGPARLAVLHLEGETVMLNPPAGGFPPGLLVAGTPAKSQTLQAVANKDKLSPQDRKSVV